MSLKILPPSKTIFSYQPLGLGFIKPKDPFAFNYNATGAKLIKPGPDGYMSGDRPYPAAYYTRGPIMVRPPIAVGTTHNKWTLNGRVFPNFTTLEQQAPKEFIVLKPGK